MPASPASHSKNNETNPQSYPPSWGKGHYHVPTADTQGSGSHVPSQTGTMGQKQNTKLSARFYNWFFV